jgi:uncharacterized membrane protein YhaH (DUF805 family)
MHPLSRSAWIMARSPARVTSTVVMIAALYQLPYHPRNDGGRDMEFGQAISTCFSKYATFAGRATRAEYWYFVLFISVATVVLGIIDLALPYGVLEPIFSLATLLPSIAVMIRRLHDVDRSGWWWLIVFVPLVGWILLIVWLSTRGTSGPNRFGSAPDRAVPTLA